MRPPTDPNKVKPMNPKSLVWDYFEDCFDGKHVFCALCQKINKEQRYKVTDSQTSSLREHIETKHIAEWRDMKQQEGEKSKKDQKEKEERAAKKQKLGAGAGQPTIFQAVNKMTKVDPQGAKQKSFDKLFLELLACNFLPFNLADSPEWHSLVQYLDKTINLKTGSTYSKQLEKFAAEVQEDVQKLISEFCDAGAAVTTDLWDSRVGDSYISGTLHFVDKGFRLHRYPLKLLLLL